MFHNKRLQTFWRDQSGVATLELTLLMPVLFLMIFGTYSMFDLFYNYNKSIKSTQTIADILSRQTEIDNERLGQLHNVFRSLSLSKPDDRSWMRVTSVKNTSGDPETQELEVSWSHAEGDSSARDGSGVDFSSHIPELAPGESVVLVETYREATPVLNWDPTVIGGTRKFPNSMTVKLRWSSSLKNLDYDESDGGNSNGGDDTGGGA